MTVEEVAVEVTPKYVSPLSDPIVSGKLLSRAMKLIKKAHGAKAVRRGVPECTKLIRKGKKGILILAADIFPVDLIAHLPVLAEENEIFYAFVPSRAELGVALSSKRAVSAIYVMEPTEDSVHAELYKSFKDGLEVVHPFMGSGKRALEADPAAEEEQPKKKKKKVKSAEVEA